MRQTLIQLNTLQSPRFTLVAVCFLFAALGACTNERRSASPVEATVSSAGAKPNAPNNACTPEELAAFEKSEGEVFDLEREALPKGLYLATLSEMLLEKRTEAGVARLMAREIPGSRRGEILCSENMDKISTDFDMAITGLVKFDTTANPAGENFTARQFYVFSGRNGHGVIISNPELDAKSKDLKRFLSSGMSRGQMTKVSDREYVLRFVREREGAKIQLAIRLELIP